MSEAWQMLQEHVSPFLASEEMAGRLYELVEDEERPGYHRLALKGTGEPFREFLLSYVTKSLPADSNGREYWAEQLQIAIEHHLSRWAG